MDAGRARHLAEQFMPNAEEPLAAESGRVDLAALLIADRNDDGALSRDEIVTALTADRITLNSRQDTLIPAAGVGLPKPPVQTDRDRGLAGTPWFQGAIQPGNVGGPLPKPTGADSAGRTITDAAIDALAGKGFADVAGQVRTPADVSAFLNRFFTYDDGRANGGTGPAAAMSSAEALAARSGVCRDQHAVARDLLRANGMDAELLGYWSGDQKHAITAYQDPTTRQWGIIEYGTLYTPEQLKARTPEEALLMVRPNALLVRHYSTEGPDRRSVVDGVMYTPLSRAYTAFMQGPSPEARSGVSVDSTGASLTAAAGKDNDWQASVKVFTDARVPQLQGAVMAGAWKTFHDARGQTRIGLGGGYAPNATYLEVGSNTASANATGYLFVSAEEFHPELLRWRDIGGSGVNVGVGSHTTATGALAFSERGNETSSTGAALTNLKTNPELAVDRSFSIFGSGQPDLNLRLGAGVGADTMLLAEHYRMGGSGLPVNTYVTGTVTARPLPWLGVQTSGYVPITNASNDFLASPAVRLAVTTPYAAVGTTQSAERGRYDLAVGTRVGPAIVGGFAAVDQDRRTGQTGYTVGGQLTVASW
jgi:hypothetical protein